MGDPLHLILAVVNKAFIEVRQLRGDLHKHVRLLDVVLHTRHGRYHHVGGECVPFIKMIGLQVKNGGKRIREFAMRRGNDYNDLPLHIESRPFCNWGVYL